MASEMGYDEFHMYLRLLQFEFASRKERVDPSPSMITSFTVDDMSADRFVFAASFVVYLTLSLGGCLACYTSPCY